MAHGEYSRRLDGGAAGLLVSPLAPATIMSRVLVLLLATAAAAAPEAPPLHVGTYSVRGLSSDRCLTNLGHGEPQVRDCRVAASVDRQKFSFATVRQRTGPEGGAYATPARRDEMAHPTYRVESVLQEGTCLGTAGASSTKGGAAAWVDCIDDEYEPSILWKVRGTAAAARTTATATPADSLLHHL